MPLDNSKLKKIYEVLKSGGYSEDYKTFVNGFAGNDNYPKRKAVYDTLREGGAKGEEIGNTYEEFIKMMYKPAAPQKPAAQAPTAQKPAAEPDTQTPAAKPSSPTNSKKNAWKPSGEFMADTQSTLSDIQGTLQHVRKQTENLKTYSRQRMSNALGVPRIGLTVGDSKNPSLLDNKNVVEAGLEYNPNTGKFEKTYITQAGNNHLSRASADIEQRQIDDALERKLHPIETQLRDAYAERDRLEELAKERMYQLDKEFNDKPWYLRALKLLHDGYQTPYQYDEFARYDADTKYSSYMTAIRNINQLITTLEDKKDGKTNEFWHSFGTEATNGYTFSLLGKNQIIDAASLYKASLYADKINKKRNTGEPLTEEEQEAEEVLKAATWNNIVQGEYGDQYGAWARAGKTTAVGADFMIDFLLAGGGPASTAKGVYSGVVKGGTKLLGKFATKSLGKFALKSTGVTLGALAGGAQIANTVRLPKTMADAASLYTGDVFADDKGNYVFGHFEEDENGKPKFVKGGESAIGAILKAERSAITESASELVGEFLPGSKVILKEMSNVGLRKISGFLTSIGNKNWYKNYTRALKATGFHGTAGEAFEEYIGMGLDAMLGGDEWKNLAQLDTHIDIWLGCATMGGILGAPKVIGTGYSMAKYYKYKNDVGKSDKTCESLFNEKWGEMRDAIDNAENDKISSVVSNLLKSQENLNNEQAKALIGYAINLQRMRGYNIAMNNNEDNEEKDENAQALDESYAIGYNTSEAKGMRDLSISLSEQRKRLEGIVGEGSDFMAVLDGAPYKALQHIKDSDLKEDEKKIVTDYVFQQNSYNAMTERINNDAEGQYISSVYTYSNKTNKQDGNLHQATLKEKSKDGTNKQVFILDGEVVMTEDGESVDAEKSDKTIVIYDTETGEKKQIDPASALGIQSLDAVIGMDEIMQQAEDQKQQYIQQQMDIASGTIRLNVGEEITLPSGEKALVVSIDQTGETAIVRNEKGEQTEVSRADLQAYADQQAIEEYKQRNGLQQESTSEEPAEPTQQEAEAAPEPASEQTTNTQGAPAVYKGGMTLTIRDEDGAEKEAMVVGRVRTVNNNGHLEYELDENGGIVQYIMDGEVRRDRIQELNDKVVGYTTNEEEQQAAQTFQGSNVPSQYRQGDRFMVSDGRERFDAEIIAEENEDGLLTVQFEGNGGTFVKRVSPTDLEALIDTYISQLAEVSEPTTPQPVQQKYKKGDTLKIYDGEEAYEAKVVDSPNEEGLIPVRVKGKEGDYIQMFAPQTLDELTTPQKQTSEEQPTAETPAAQTETTAASQAQQVADNGATLAAPTQTEAGSNFPTTEQSAETDKAENENVIGELSPIPVEKNKKGKVVRMLYHKVPMQRTLEDLYDGAMDQAEIDQYVDKYIANSKKRLDELQNKKIDVGMNKQAYLEAKKKHEADLAEAQAEVEYYEKLKQEVQRITQRDARNEPTTEPTSNEPLTLEEVAANFAATHKVTPESIKAETGMAGRELNGYVGLVAKAENGGVSIERMAEMLTESQEWANLGGTTDMTQEARNMLIEAFRTGNPRSYAKKQRQRYAEREQESELQEIERYAWQAYHMTAEEFLAYEEQALPAIIQKYAGFDFEKYYASLCEQAEQMARESEINNTSQQPTNNPTNNGQPTESTEDGGSSQVLPRKESNDKPRETDAGQPAAGQPEGTGNDGIQSPVSQGTLGEREQGGAQTKDNVQIDDGRGGNGSPAGRQQSDLAQREEINYQLSDEVDENGHQFVLNSEGKIEFGHIGEDTGLTPAPILLSEGIITNKKTNAGYGLLHIEARHGDQIRAAGYDSVLEFIEEVAKRYEVIRKGNDRDGRETYMLQLTDKHNNTLMVELSGDGTYWNINTAGIFKTSYGANRDIVYDRHTTDNQPAETDEASLSGEQSGTTPSTRMNAPTQSYQNSVLDNTTDTGKTLMGNGNDTATPGNTVSSASKGNQNKPQSETKQTETAESLPNNISEQVKAAEAETNTNPTEAQKQAGNYKKGHLKIDGFDVSIENPKGSVRRGTDASGKQWEQTMHNTYGYLRGTEGVDGDHIDVFLSDNPEQGDVFVVDQVNKDGTFDEHKVMYGFPSEENARQAYLANYEDGWQGLGAITRVSREEFKKWVQSSHRKTKPFAEYKGVRTKQEPAAATDANNLKPTVDDNNEKQTPRELKGYNHGYEDKVCRKELSSLREQMSNPHGRHLTEEDVENTISTYRESLDVYERGLASQPDSMKPLTLHNIAGVYGKIRALEQFLSEIRQQTPATENQDTSGKTSEADQKTTEAQEKQTPVSRKENGKNTLYQKADIAEPVSKEEAALRDALVEFPREAGIDIVMDAEDGQRMLDAVNGGVRMMGSRVDRRMEDVGLRLEGRELGVNEKAVVDVYSGKAKSNSVSVERDDKEHRIVMRQGTENRAGTKHSLLRHYGTGVGPITAEDLLLIPEVIERGEMEQNGKKRVYRLSKDGVKYTVLSEVNNGREEFCDFYSNRKGGDTSSSNTQTSARDYDVTTNSDAKVHEKSDTSKSNDAKLQKSAPSVNDVHKKQQQLQIINDTNPAPDDYHTWVRSTDDILTLSEAVDEVLREDPNYNLSSYPDVSDEMIRKALQTGRITIYSSNPIKNGAFVTPSLMQAQDYAGRGKVYSAEVNTPDVAWINTDEGMFASTSNAQPTSGGSTIRFFRTKDGHAYGFVKDGKIYIDPRTARADTPIHEYTHLWAEAFRRVNPEGWKDIVRLMKGTDLWEQVRRQYPELTAEDELAEEVLAHYSGRRGAERLRAEQERILKSDADIVEKAAAVSAIQRVKEALSKFWRGVAEWLGLRFTTAEEVADRVLADMLHGVNPAKVARSEGQRLRMEQNGEEAQIVARAKADGTYLKAPNGRPSHLSPQQWVQVRTRAFREWFGDWEKAARIDKLRKSKGASITGKEIEVSDDYKENKKNALEYGKKLQGEYTNADTGISVQLQRGRKNGGIKEVLQHNYKDVPHILSVAAIPQIIEKSIYIESEPNNDIAKNPDVVEYQHFVCGLKIGNEDYTVHSLIAVDKRGNRYYDHNLTQIEKTKLLDQIEGQAVKGQGFDATSGTEPTTLNGYKGKKLFSILQTNCSKVVDENGEPMVVYHGSGNRRIRQFNSENGMTWVSSMKGYAEAAFGKGGRTYSLLANIRKPLYVGNVGTYLNVGRFCEATGLPYEEVVSIAKGLGAKWVYELTNSNEFRQLAIQHGYDGLEAIEAGGRAYAAFTPTQIKSATDNVGTFSSKNPDIRYHRAVGEEIAREQEAEETSIEAANKRFNEELSGLTEENKDKTILSLGRPSAVLLSAGVENKPMKLYGNKVIKKMKKHGFSLDELRNLPAAVADPIAVFDNIGRIGNRSILTELRTEQGNFLVTIDLGKGKEDIDFNIVSSVFGKSDNNIVDWINKGLATYINKEKALNYLHHSALIAEALSNPRLISAAKVVESFENPKVVDGKVLDSGDRGDSGYQSSSDGKSVSYKSEGGEHVEWRSLFSDAEMRGVAPVFDPTGIRLRKLEDGEQCNVERRYIENGMFDFTGKERIESEADVAYIFRQLENSAVENSFLVLLKDGTPTVIHLGMGDYTSTVAPIEQAFVAYSKMNPDEVYFVHNHPSGNIKASTQDQRMMDHLRKLFGREVVKPGIIINTTSGKFGVFDSDINIEEDMQAEQQAVVPIRVYNFGKQVFASDWNPREAFKIRNSDDVASFISSHRLGEHDKMSLLVLGNDNSVVANLFLPFTNIGDLANKDKLMEACDLIAGYVHQCGGIRCVVYGNYGYSHSEEKTLNRMVFRLKEMKAPLLDAIHITHSAREEGIVYEPNSEDMNIDAVNKRFNAELQKQIDGTLKDGHIYQLGFPSVILKSTGIPDLPIQMNSTRLKEKATTYGHDFSLSDVNGLVNALQEPVAVFAYGNKDKAQNVIVEIQRNGKNFVVGLSIRPTVNGRVLDINSIRNVFPKDNAEWLNRINQGKLLYADKEKIQTLIDQQRTILADVEYLDLDSAAKVVKDFENPSLPSENLDDTAAYRQKSGEESTNANTQTTALEKRNTAQQLADRLNTPIRIVESTDEITHPNTAVQARRRRANGWYDRRTGEVVIVLPNCESTEDVAATVAHETIAHKGLRELVGEERYDEFLDKVYSHLRGDLKQQVEAEATRAFIDDTTKNGKRARSYEQHRRTATDELLGRMAEKPFEEFTEGERTLWQKIKAAARKIIDRFLGKLKLPSWFELGDNELRYILWRSKERLERGREHPIDLARDIVKREELGLTDEARYNMGDVTEPSFASRRDKAVKEHGYVHPGLNSAVVKVVAIKEKSPFDTSKKTKALKADVVGYADEHGIIGNMTEEETKGKGKVTISKASIEKMVDDSSTGKSVDKDTHLAILPRLREVIAESVMAETHPDYNKGKDGKRSAENGYNPDNLIHRCYGAIRVDVQDYRVKLTLKENPSQISRKAYTYEVTKIELLDSTDGERTGLSSSYQSNSNGMGSHPQSEIGSSYPLAKLLKDVEKSYDKGKKLLDDSNSSEEETALYKDGDFTPRDRAIARDSYNRMVGSGMYQFQEAMQDSMLGLKRLYQSILGKDTRIEDVKGFENAYLAENRMSSVNAAEQHEYYVTFMKPLIAAVGELAGTNESMRQELTDYMMAKHGLERNEVMANRDFKKYKSENPNGKKTLKYFRNRDYAGLTALTGKDNVADAEDAARLMVQDYEREHDTTELWNCVNAATSATLEKIFQSGLLSRENYEQIKQMYKNYIPLRGWDETTSDEVYGYLTSKNGPLGSSPIKRAEGRSSKADDPIATIALMADDAIRQGNRNLMKQAFLNFVFNHPSDLVSVGDLWLKYNDITDEWEPVFVDIEDGDTSEDISKKVEAFEARMEQLAKTDKAHYKRGRDAQSIPYKVVKNNINEHQVLVRRNGRTYVLTVNGNPRAAQALNGLTNPDVDTKGVIGNLLRSAERVNRFISAAYTTRNPDFVVSNFVRDLVYSNCMVWVKEGGEYAVRFHKNVGRVNPWSINKLFRKWNNGNLDESIYLERMFKAFMLGGGETGYTNIKDIEGHKREIAKELKRNGNKVRNAWAIFTKQLDLIGGSVENCARFAAFLTSREMGRSVERSIYDAKEISVNFNKKGSGGKMLGASGQTTLGNIGSYTSGAGRLLYIFWNAAIQGSTNFGRQVKRNPKKALTAMATMYILGSLAPILAKLIGGDDEDDKNAYYNLPENVRRSNLCLYAGDTWIKIALPVEFRAFYGLGELSSGVLTRGERYSNEELTYQIAGQVSQLFPIDMLEGGGGFKVFVPSLAKPIYEAEKNQSWTGLPIYKDTEWNKNDPEWTKVYQNANSHLVNLSKWANELTGGDDYKKGYIDINPAKIEHELYGYFGGAFSTIDKLVKMGETAFGEREFEWRNMLLANRVLATGDERTENRKLTNEYFKYNDMYEETRRLQKHYEEASETDDKYKAKLALLRQSEEYTIFEVFDSYKPLFKALYDAKKDADETTLKRLEQEEHDLRREMVDLIHEIEDDKNPNIDGRVSSMLQREFEKNGETRKSAAARIAKNMGGKDTYGSPTTEYGKIYESKRDYIDLAEDVLLQSESKKAKDGGDKARYKRIESARMKLTEMRKVLERTPYEDSNGNIVTEEDVMNRIRTARRKIIQNLGLDK